MALDTWVEIFLARLLNTFCIFSGFLSTPSTLFTSSWIKDLTYSLANLYLASLFTSIDAGHPPLTIILAKSSKDSFDTPDISLPSKISLNDTSPVDSPDSYKLIGRINTLDILPVPVCIVSPSLGLAEPVRIYCPFSPLWSTSVLIESHTTGYICHSSNILGFSPFKNNDGWVFFILSYSCFLSGFWNSMILFAWCIPVVDFPHHLQPSISTAPIISISSSISLSTTLGKYSIVSLLFSQSNYNIILQKKQILFYILRKYCFSKNACFNLLFINT